MKKKFTFVILFANLLIQYVSAQTGSVNLFPPNGIVTTYSSIGAAYAAITTPLTGNYLIEFTAAYSGASETFPIELTDKGLLPGGNTITIRPAAGNINSVIQRPTPAAGAIIQFNGADNVILDGRPGGFTYNSSLYLTINDTYSGGNANRNIELLNGANNNIIRFINSFAAAVTSNGGGSRNIFVGVGTTTTGGNNNNTITNCVVSGGLRGIQDYGLSTTVFNNGTIISNDTVRAFGDIGIFAGSYQTNITVQNNYIALNGDNDLVPASISGIQQQTFAGTANILNNTISLVTTSTTVPGMSGIYDGGIGTENIRGNNIIALSLPAVTGNTLINGIGVGIITLSGATVFNISQNKISGLSSTGSASFRGISIFPFTNSTVNINNNFVSITDNNTSTSSVFGILLGYTAAGDNYTTNLYYNSIRIGGAQAVTNKASAYGIYKGDKNAGSVYNQRNNIAIMERSGGYPDTAHFIGFLLSSTAGTNTVNYNTYYANDAMNGFAAGGWDGNLYRNTALTSYKTGSGTQEQNSNFTNVSFVSKTDLHLNSPSNTNNTLYGTPISGIITDIDGNNRSANNPFQGADEPSIILPIQFVSFTGERTETYNTLRWQTATELNNRGFYLERSVDGKTFSSLSFIPSKAINGNSTVVLNYSFDDVNPLNSKGYYRLKEIDLNGNIIYSDTIIIFGKSPLALFISSVYPNPAVTSLNLIVKTPADAKAVITITDAVGKKVFQQNTTLKTGDNYLSVGTAALSSGMYTLSLKEMNINEPVTVRFIK